MKIDLSAFERCRLLVVGDLMLDEYLWGTVERISPEAPVPVLSVAREEFTLGGAGNVAKNLTALGARVAVGGLIGPGAYGRKLLKELSAIGADVSAVIKDPGRPTTRKTRIVADHQQLLRIDRESPGPLMPRVLKKLMARLIEGLAQADALLISDYGKGVVSRELVAALAEQARREGKPAIADPKGRDYTKYGGLTLITPNRKEALLAAGSEAADEAGLIEAGTRLLRETGVDKLLITCGKDGMLFFEPGAAPLKVGTRARQVFDVSGAGDTVLAGLGLGLAAGLSYPEAIALANTAAGIVVGKVGTATVTRAELTEAFQPTADLSLYKHKDLIQIRIISQELRRRGKRIVLTNGCFDLLHVGHIRLFSAAKQCGDVLIVALDDDASVARLKGPGRPVIGAAERVRILNALDSVDYVVQFATEELAQIIDAIRPDVLAKGSNYEADRVAGREQVERLGGRVALIPVTEDISSTRIIESIKRV